MLTDDIYRVAGFITQIGHIFRIHENHTPFAVHPAIAIVHAVDRGVVLVMRAERLQDEQAATIARALKLRLFRQCAAEELRLASGRVPLTLARGISQIEAARLAHARVVVFEARDHGGDVIADEIVVVREPQPIDLVRPDRGRSDARHNRHLRPQLFRRGRVDATGPVHHAHRVFDADDLRNAARVAIDLGAPQARQDEADLPRHQVRMIELGGDVHGQRQRGHRFRDESAVGRGACEVATEADERVRAAVEHGANSSQHVVARLARRRESELPLQCIEKCRRRILVDADGTIALDVRVAAHGAHACTRPAEVPAQ